MSKIALVEKEKTIMLNKQTASEYDFIVCLDASGSMGSDSNRFSGKTRWEEAQETIFGITSELNKFDADGIDVVVFGGSVEMYNNVTPTKVSDIFANRGPRGSTPLAEALKKVVDRQRSTGKNTVAIVFTDGVPDDKIAAARVIMEAANKIESDEKLTFLFVQIGNDASATKYLQALDDDLKGAKFDIVDTMFAPEADKMEPLALINRAISD